MRSKIKRHLLRTIVSDLQSLHQRHHESKIIHHEQIDLREQISMNQLELFRTRIALVISNHEHHQLVVQKDVALLVCDRVAKSHKQQLLDSRELFLSNLKQQSQLRTKKRDSLEKN